MPTAQRRDGCPVEWGGVGVSSPPAEEYPKGEVVFHKCKISGIKKTTPSPFGATPFHRKGELRALQAQGDPGLRRDDVMFFVGPDTAV